jgi:hypothetical protein
MMSKCGRERGKESLNPVLISSLAQSSRQRSLRYAGWVMYGSDIRWRYPPITACVAAMTRVTKGILCFSCRSRLGHVGPLSARVVHPGSAMG